MKGRIEEMDTSGASMTAASLSWMIIVAGFEGRLCPMAASGAGEVCTSWGWSIKHRQVAFLGLRTTPGPLVTNCRSRSHKTAPGLQG
ncbi:hypothetical protein [Actinoplanes italicus]|uniref:hypothetical protein n=1 Tax=Actinoplanes italicus TaxID=113567 RepID=UPI0011B20BD6|nr:hypothetical protein [Actinoplanes italicus]